MEHLTFEEETLAAIYNGGSREGTILNLREMRGCLAADETELLELTDSTIGKLEAMSDADIVI